MSPGEFIRFWCDSHGYRAFTFAEEYMTTPCRRIEWRYIDPRKDGE